MAPQDRSWLAQGTEWLSLEELAETAQQVLEKVDALAEDDLATDSGFALFVGAKQDRF